MSEKHYDSDGREYTPSRPKIEEVSEPVSSSNGLNEPGAAESTVSPSEPEHTKE